jgi:perosamine synthetase
VIVPSLTYIATANAVTYCGATPVFADCDIDTWNISRETIEPLINEQTKGVIVVHLYGNPVDMDPILAMAQSRNLFVVEDAAEAHGARYKEASVGSFGDLATFSFYGNKLMTTGEGGMVVTNKDEYARELKLYRGQGMDPKRRYWFPIVGYNYRLTNIQCAIGLAQLERLSEFIAVRQELAGEYRSAFEAIDGITLQEEQKDAESVWWLSNVVLPDATRRDAVMSVLAENGIETRPIFYPLHLLPPYKAKNHICQNAERIGLAGLSLPSGRHVNDSDVSKIVHIIKNHIIKK